MYSVRPLPTCAIERYYWNVLYINNEQIEASHKVLNDTHYNEYNSYTYIWGVWQGYFEELLNGEQEGLVMKEMAYWVRKLLGRKWCEHFVSSK